MTTWYDEPLHLLIFRPDGVLGSATLREYFRQHAEQPYWHQADRFTDLNHCRIASDDAIQVGELVCHRRQRWPIQGPIRSAILATNDVSYGMARMYEQLLNEASVQLCICRNLFEAAAFLDRPMVVLEQLRPPHMDSDAV